MNFADDTIAAISTPIGQGGIGIVRMSGTKSVEIAGRVFMPAKGKSISDVGTFSMRYGYVVDAAGEVIDEAVLSVMRAPRSYTREDIVEINCHGGMVAVRKILEGLLARGARLAEPGEFTLRAFLNGRINLAQAEAVMDLISARTEEGLRLAADQLRGGLSEKLSEIRESLIEDCAFTEAYIDFPEEEIEAKTREEIAGRLGSTREELRRLSRTFDEARFFMEGLSVAIVGRPNVGKSSLLNALLNKARAIVTPLPGTTRDIIEEQLNINGLPVIIVDTAGIRHSEEIVEQEGVRRSLEAMEKADFIVAVVDGSGPLHDGDREILERTKGRNALVAVNKSDLPLKIIPEELSAFGKDVLFISATAGTGLDELKTAIFEANLRDWKEERQGVVVTNLRHKIAIDEAESALGRAIDVFGGDQPLEIFSMEVREALERIGEITGSVTTEEILGKIFSNFCIGK